MTTMSEQNSADRTRQFVELLASHEHRLTNYVISLVPNWADADDLIQQTKIRLWEQFDQYDVARDFGCWACAIAHYLILAHRKTAQRGHVKFSQVFIEAMAAEVSSLAPEEDARHLALEQCLKGLSENMRRLIALCYSGNRSIKDAALLLGRSVGATQKAVFRIRKRLQECVEEQLQHEGPA